MMAALMKASDQHAAELLRDKKLSKKLVHLGLLVILDEIADEMVAKGEARRCLVNGKPGLRLTKKGKRARRRT
jgi:hypothetical protein